MPTRKPFAVANWKMAMTIADSPAFIRQFTDRVGPSAEHVEVVLCPPYTALHPVAQVLAGSPVQLGGQNLFTAVGTAHTGEMSTKLLADVGCEWVMGGHWEVRRRMLETDRDVNEKLRAALQVGLRPILLVGEGTNGGVRTLWRSGSRFCSASSRPLR